MDNQKFTLVSAISVIAVILGAVIGYFFPDTFSNDIFGTLLLNGLTILMVPIIIVVLINAIVGMGITSKSNRSFYKSIGIFASATVISAILAVAVSFLIKPNINGFLSYQTSVDNSAFSAYLVEVYSGFSFNAIISSIYSGSFWSDISSGNVLGLVLLVVLFGSVILKMENRNTIVTDFFKVINQILDKVVTYLLWFIPVALFFSAASIFSEQSDQAYKLFQFLGPFTITFIGLAILLVGVIYPLFVRLYGHRNPLEFYRGILPAIATAFITGSKTAAFPVAVNNLNRIDDFDSRSTGFTLPVGMIFNTSGHTLFYALGTMYLLSLWGTDLTIGMIGFIIIGSILLSLVASLIPLGSTIILLSIVMPLAPDPNTAAQGIIFLFLGEWLFNRVAQAVNVVGDCSAAVILSESFDFKTARVTHTSAPSPRTSQRKQRERKSSDSFSNNRKDRKAPRKERQPRKERTTTAKKSSNDNGSKKREKPQSKKDEPIKKVTSKYTKAESKPQKKEFKETKQIVKPEPVEVKSKETEKQKTASSNFSIPPVPHHFLEKISEDAKKYSSSEKSLAESNNGSSADSKPEKAETETKKQTTQPENRPLAASTAPEPDSNDSQSDDLFAKERAKIRAQLDAMAGSPAKSKESDTTADDKENKPESEQFATIDFVPDFDEQDKKSGDTGNDDITDGKSKVIDKVVDTSATEESPEKSKSEPEHNTANVSETVSEENSAEAVPETIPADDDEESEDMVYGRTRKSKKSLVVKNESDNSPETSSENSEEFGKSSYEKKEMSFGRGRRKK